jgi:hypothetical protein
MDDNPFYRRHSLADIIGSTPSTQPPPNPFLALAPQSPLAQPSQLNALTSPPPPPRHLPGVPPAVRAFTAPSPLLRRKVYFAFDFDDVIRVNNVRQNGKIGSREQNNPRSFYDRSMWEKRDIKSEETLKNLMRQAVRYSSTVCVLIGTNTWKSRWVKYEIARAVIEERGLLAVHLNGINHNVRRTPDRRGVNPLHVMGVYHNHNGNYYLYDWHLVVRNAATAELGYEWRPFEDFTDRVPCRSTFPPSLLALAR